MAIKKRKKKSVKKHGTSKNFFQFTNGKRRKGETSWSEDRLCLTMFWDSKLKSFVKKNKEKLLNMKKDEKILALRKNSPHIGDDSTIKNRYVRRSYLDKCIREV